MILDFGLEEEEARGMWRKGCGGDGLGRLRKGHWGLGNWILGATGGWTLGIGRLEIRGAQVAEHVPSMS